MENTNDKQAAGTIDTPSMADIGNAAMAWAGKYHSAFLATRNQAPAAWDGMMALIREHCAAMAEEARREAAEQALAHYEGKIAELLSARAAQRTAGGDAVDEETERTAWMDRTYPIPGNPHASVQERTMQNRVAFGIGWDARAALSKLDWQQGYADGMDMAESFAAQPVEEAAAQADNKIEAMRQELRGAWHIQRSAPTAPTPVNNRPDNIYDLDGVGLNEGAQPTPPDDERAAFEARARDREMFGGAFWAWCAWQEATRRAALRHPPVPGQWDEWALERARALVKRTEEVNHPRYMLVSAIQSALVEAMEFAHPPVPSVGELRDHEIAAFVYKVRDIAIQFRDAQQLRARLADVLVPILRGAASNPADEDAARWREAIKHVGGAWLGMGIQGFTLRYLSPVAGTDLMRGSVAEHFTAAIDAARAAAAKEKP